MELHFGQINGYDEPLFTSLTTPTWCIYKCIYSYAYLYIRAHLASKLAINSNWLYLLPKLYYSLITKTDFAFFLNDYGNSGNACI